MKDGFEHKSERGRRNQNCRGTHAELYSRDEIYTTGNSISITYSDSFKHIYMHTAPTAHRGSHIGCRANMLAKSFGGFRLLYGCSDCMSQVTRHSRALHIMTAALDLDREVRCCYSR